MGERQYFGTDGIRGTANRHPMTVEVATKVARAAGYLFSQRDGRSHWILIGKDTRRSGYMIEAAMVAGFTSVGLNVLQVGPLPTSGVAMLTRAMRADGGVMISASHNSFEDNGNKFFDADGNKLSDEVELEIERLMSCDKLDAFRPEGKEIGRAVRIEDAKGRYIEYCKATVPRRLRLDGLKLVVDAANGAAYHVAGEVFYELGAEVITTGINPNGLNINDGVGALHPEHLANLVKEHGADAGIALDGDADRLIMVDETGRVLDGDDILGMVGVILHREGQLRGPVVATVMSNMGLERLLAAHGIEFVRTAVGDRYVLEGMAEHGSNVGGEQSGHLIMSDYVTTGDGIIAALQVLRATVVAQAPLSRVAGQLERYPQRLVNVALSAPLSREDKQKLADLSRDLSQSILDARSDGRVVLRPSGTEPKLRIMVEARSEDLLASLLSEAREQVASLLNIAV
ncbi:MAG: phosphoglucosamine mutase [Proteobacteria bacterium CG1_02_64_396]|nr:MAG: phosphoglucosamine mutase [Proteobacteria bacterium CG1_02_64_396]